MKTTIIAITLSLLALAAHAAERAPGQFEFEEDFSLPVVYFNLVVDAGAVNDPQTKLGLTNIASRMLLRGTTAHNKTEFNEMLNRLGGELDVDVREEGVVFTGAVLSENAEKFLALVTEAFVKPKFTSGELAKLKKEVTGEILERKGNDRTLVQYNFYRFLYGSHPYSHPTVGTQKGVANINHRDIIDFYANRIGAKTLHLFGTGAVRTDVVEKWFTTLTEKLAALHPEAAPAPGVAKPQLAPGRRALIVNKPSATQAQVLMGGAGIRPEDPRFYAIQLGNYPFGGPSFQARLMDQIRVKRGWTYGAYNTFRFGREPKHYAMYFFPKTGDTVPAIGLALELFDAWVQKGISKDEYTFARESLINKAPFNYDTSKKRLENATSEYIMNFPHGFYHDLADNLGKVAYDDVNPAIKSFFQPDNLALTVVGDASKLKEPMSKLPGFKAPEVKSYLQD